MSAYPDSTERITRLRHRYLNEVAVISIQRARYYTESWKKSEGNGLSIGQRVALAMTNVFEKMDFHIDPDDRIAGSWTEHFLGVPIDIEKGLFNEVFAVELSRRAMVFHNLKDTARFITYMIRRYGLLFLLQKPQGDKGHGSRHAVHWHHHDGQAARQSLQDGRTGQKDPVG